MIFIFSDVQPLSSSMLWRMGLVRHSCTPPPRVRVARPGPGPRSLMWRATSGIRSLRRRSVSISESAAGGRRGRSPYAGTSYNRGRACSYWIGQVNVWHHPRYHTPQPHQIERIWETSQHVRFPTIKTTVPGDAHRMPTEEADWPVPRRMVTQSEALPYMSAI